MHLNNTHFVSGSERNLLPKSSIYEADLLDPSTFSTARHFSALQTDTGAFPHMLISVSLPPTQRSLFGHETHDRCS